MKIPFTILIILGIANTALSMSADNSTPYLNAVLSPVCFFLAGYIGGRHA